MRRAPRVIGWLRLWVLAAASLLALGLRADEIGLVDARLREAEEGLVLDADFAIELNPRLSQAVASGVALYFSVEFEFTRPRWYWFDQKLGHRRLQLRLSHHAVSRQYRLSSGSLQQSFSTLSDALEVLRRVRGWLVIERAALEVDAPYEAALRMRLDPSLLPRPIQVSALTSGEWNLDSGWKRMKYRTPQQAPAPVESREQRGVPTQ